MNISHAGNILKAVFIWVGGLAGIGALVKWFLSVKKINAEIEKLRMEIDGLKKDQKKESLRQSMRDLKREYRKMHTVPSAFMLGAEYYIGHMTNGTTDAALIYELIESEGEPENSIVGPARRDV
jgi:hypothetical protein